ncbi:MAG: DsbA family protein [Chloroflexi bacterium]|nr:DsbA family protein [Chloroflexota bacterium]
MSKKRTQPVPHKGSHLRSERSDDSRSDHNILWIGGAVALALVVVLIAIAVPGNKTATLPSDGSSLSQRLGQPVDGRVIGAADAPVVVQVYEDFQCPHCQDFTAELEPTIMELVADGTVRYEYHHRFVSGPDSIVAGAAAECATDQGAFWEYHDALYAGIRSNPRIVQPDALKAIAVDIGLDSAKFDRCFDTQEHYEQMLRENNEASNRGINATPTILINGTKYQGDFNPETFRAAIEAAAQ